MTDRILTLIRNWEIKQSGLTPEQRNAVREEINEIGDAIEAELRNGSFEQIGAPADRVMVSLARKTGRIQ